MESGGGSEEGHAHHLRSINAIRRLGGIRQAVDQKLLTSGIMFECVQNKIPYVLAGSICDDGPLPDVITDSLVAQKTADARIGSGSDVLPDDCHHAAQHCGGQHASRAGVRRHQSRHRHGRSSTFQYGPVTDVEPFLRILVHELGG